jgi:uncharacterized protein (DUF305 family)
MIRQGAMSSVFKSMRVLAVALALAAAVTSCRQPDDASPPDVASSSPGASAQPAPHNAADLAFVRNMLPHHQQGVELAAMVPSHTLNPDLRVIATHIRADQQAEIRTLNLLLAQWHESAAIDHGGGPGHGGMTMTGMVDQATMDKLKSLDSAAFDNLWATSMISHHQGAIAMAQTEISHGQSADAIHVATLIIEAQQREISLMTHLMSAMQ